MSFRCQVSECYLFKRFAINRENVIDENHLVTIKGPNSTTHNFVVNATIVDLDMKKDSIAHYCKYKKQYRESQQAYSDFMKQPDIKFQD